MLCVWGICAHAALRGKLLSFSWKDVMPSSLYLQSTVKVWRKFVEESALWPGRAQINSSKWQSLGPDPGAHAVSLIFPSSRQQETSSRIPHILSQALSWVLLCIRSFKSPQKVYEVDTVNVSIYLMGKWRPREGKPHAPRTRARIHTQVAWLLGS